MEGVKYQLKVDGIDSEMFSVETGLQQGDAFSPLLFNIDLEKVVRILLDEARGIKENQHHIKIFGFTNDLEILRDSLQDTAKVTVTLERTSRQIGLQINTGYSISIQQFCSNFKHHHLRVS